MLFVAPFFLLLNLILSWLLLGRNNVVFIFNFWWFFWVLMSSLNFMNLFEVRLSTYALIVSGVISLNVGYFIGRQIRSKSFGVHNIKKLRINIFIEIVYFFVLIILLLNMINLIENIENFYKTRFYFFGIELNGVVINIFPSALHANLFFILKAISLFNFLLSLTYAFYYNRKILLYLCFVNMIIFGFLSGGRDIIGYLVIIFLFLYHSKLIIKKSSIIFVGVFVVLVLTYLREGDLSIIFYAVTSYFTGSIVHLDLLLDESEFYYFGLVFLSNAFGPISSILNLNVHSEIGTSLMEFTRIANDSKFFDYYNALPTWFYFFYRDFGYIGFIAPPLIIGFIISAIVNKLKFNEPQHLALIAFIEFNLIWSILKLDITNFYTIIVIIVYLFYISKYKLISN